MNNFFIGIIKILIFLCWSNFASAQIENGNYTLGGSAGIENISSAFANTFGYNTTVINIHPMYGWFFTDRFLLGASANLNYQYIGRGGNTIINVGPIIRYYFNNIFVQADYSFGILIRGYVEQDAFLRLGYAYFLNESVAIEPYVFIGLRDQFSRNGNYNYGYLDEGIYFSVQVYLESTLNKAVKMRKGIFKRNQ